MAIIEGTPFNDNLYGTPENDWIYAYEGDDYVYADGGDDYVDGWTGNDIIDGWTGNDTLLGFDGDDTLWGYTGDDKLYGESGNDYLYGESGNDNLNGGTGQDYLSGGAGADIFDFDSSSESPAGGAYDTISDFNWKVSEGEGDKMDLSTIDADEWLDGDQAFNLSQLSYDAVTGVLTADVYEIPFLGSGDLQVKVVGVDNLPVSEFSTYLDVIA